MSTNSTPGDDQDLGRSSSDGIKPGPTSSGKDKTEDETTVATPSNEGLSKESSMTQNIWIFMFRGLPYDTYNRRHVLLYLDSPDVEDFHITAHAQRPTETTPFEFVEIDGEENYPMLPEFLHGRIVGRVQVDMSHQRKVVDVIASTPVGGEPDWNCQHFVYHALERLAECDVISSGAVNDAKDWMMDCLLDGAVE